MDIDKIYLGDCMDYLKKFSGLDYVIVSDPPYNIGYNYDEYKDNLSETEYYKMLVGVIGENMPAVILHYPEYLHKLSIYLGEAPQRIISWVYNSNTARQHRDIAFYRIKPNLKNVPGEYKNLNRFIFRDYAHWGRSRALVDITRAGITPHCFLQKLPLLSHSPFTLD